MSEHYILNEAHEVVPAPLLEWAAFFEDYSKRRVRLTRVGPYFVSTVFLGLDHSFGQDGPPVVFETMVYIKTTERESEFLDTQYRCSTWPEAIAQHESVISEVMQPSDDLEEV